VSATFSKDNVLCICRENDADSLAAANRYKSIYDLEDDQIISIPCSNAEILASYSDFVTEVETPILAAIADSSRIIYCILLMPFVPGGFIDGSDVISSTSRISRINFAYSKNTRNELYNVQVFKRFDESSLEKGLICSRIDGINIVTTSWLNNIETAKKRVNIAGTFFFDPYSGYNYSGTSEYTTELVEFVNGYISRLGLTIVKTAAPPAGRDVFIPKVADDAFFWGWGADRGSLTYFGSTVNTRAFFYNADFDGGYTIRDIDARTWPILAVRQGYVATAGSMSGSNANAFLRPYPFMDALFRGATMGEAFLYAQPFLDSSIACFGDPLATFSFPVPFIQNDLIQADKAWQQMTDCLSQSVVYLQRKTNVLYEMRNHILSGNDESVQLDLDYAMDDLYKEFDEVSWRNDYVNVVNKLVNFAVDRNATSLSYFYPNLNQYLSTTGNKITKILLDTLQNEVLADSISLNNIEVEGSWAFEDTLQHNPGSFRFYHIELEVAKNLQDFEENNIILSKDTFSDVDNWYFEDLDGNFQPFNANGLTSNFEGRKFRYVNSDTEVLERAEFYWFRVRQKDDLENFEWRYFKQIIYK
jgi:hypothetical protein